MIKGLESCKENLPQRSMRGVGACISGTFPIADEPEAQGPKKPKYETQKTEVQDTKE
jgi:hypothetical protein